MTPRQTAVRVVQVLHDAGYIAYFAGGCVRDALLGIDPKDYDVATDARPEDVRRLFRRSRYVGEAFGVCLVYPSGSDGPPVEVATFRVEWGYQDGRRPDHVEFTDAEHDARRRDFTINGLFAEPEIPAPSLEDSLRGGVEKDRIIDYVGGVADLEAGIIRAIGDPDERFAEDYLRMLRAVRFAARLGFKIEPKTARAIRANAEQLVRISRERIGQEVRMMLTPCDFPGLGASGLCATGGLSASANRLSASALAGKPPVAHGPGKPPVAPVGAQPPVRAQAATVLQALELDEPTLDEAHHESPLPALAALAPEADYPTALAAWMLDRHLGAKAANLDHVARFIAEQAERQIARWRQALNLSNDESRRLAGTLDLTAQSAQWSAMGVAKRKRLLGARRWPQAMMLLRALNPGSPLTILEREAEPMLAAGVTPPALISGHDLIALGLTPGPVFGRLLEEAYDAQLEGRFSTREAAMAWLKEAISD